MIDKILKISIFVLSLICLIISLKLFLNLAIYADEFNTSPDVVLGGEFWLYMNWLRLVLSGGICVLSGISLFKDKLF
ncbi:hypothetical protein [Paraclostridium sordellii]|uniref:hypothetical protein n=1 Tax=Paraclostridium sordellii TaxID=1505 RepID=UPI000C789C73|nr:hypothetical protein [Paeniclostridium sordellii]AUN13752.1 hypothetical protein RSJ16_05725 [Paeniclostridium sordellii]